jgi:hypothetical protein
MRVTTTKTLLTTATIAALFSLGACGTAAVDGDELAESVKTELGKEVGQEPDEVDCPDDLEAEVGAETRCTLTHEGASYGVTVTATEVDGSDVNFDIEVDEEPME